MNEIERVKQEALLGDEEINTIIKELYEQNKDDAAFMAIKYGNVSQKAVAQRQIEEPLKHKKVRIEADDQELPEQVEITEETRQMAHCGQWFDEQWYGAGESDGQQAMLTPKDGKVWRKVKEEWNVYKVWL